MCLNVFMLQINDIICLPLEKAEDQEEVTPILACNDRTLKVMKVNPAAHLLQCVRLIHHIWFAECQWYSTFECNHGPMCRLLLALSL